MIPHRFREFDVTKDFFKVFPEIATIDVFDDILKNHPEPSRFMWALHLTNNIYSLMFNSPNKLEEVQSIMNTPINWKSPKVKAAVKKYKQCMLTPAHKAIQDIYEVISSRTDFLRTQEYTVENSKQLDDAHSKTDKIFNTYKAAAATILEEETKEGKEISLSDSGAI